MIDLEKEFKEYIHGMNFQMILKKNNFLMRIIKATTAAIALRKKTFWNTGSSSPDSLTNIFMQAKKNADSIKNSMPLVRLLTILSTVHRI